jgi:hypothetical protein
MKPAALLLLLPAALLTACTGLGAPTSAELSRLPVVRYGQAAPADRDFILLYPAGMDLPVNTQVTGSLLSKTDQTTLTVRVKQDVLIYRDQVSFDGKTWFNGRDKISGNIRFSLPGQEPGHPAGRLDGVSPATLAAQFDLR